MRPDWKDSKSLLGYYNPILQRYESTPLFEFILKAIIDYKENKENASPHFIILDEMNLARVEYYFAEFLSVLESGRDKEGFTKEGIKIQITGENPEDQEKKQEELFKLLKKAGIDYKTHIELKLPPNLYFIGTVNIDETTFMFSPKVLDRAFTIEFKEVDFKKYKGILEENKKNEKITFSSEDIETIRKDFTLEGKFLKYADKEGAIREAIKDLPQFDKLQKLCNTLKPYNLHFAYRVLDEIALFYKNAKEAEKNKIIEFENENEIIDLAVLMKVLPKFHGSRAKLEEPLWKVLNWCLLEPVDEFEKKKVWQKIKGEEKEPEINEITVFLKNFDKTKFIFPHTARKVLEMLLKLHTDGYAGYL